MQTRINITPDVLINTQIKFPQNYKDNTPKNKLPTLKIFYWILIIDTIYDKIIHYNNNISVVITRYTIFLEEI